MTNDLIDEYAEPITVTRTAMGSYVAGTWTPGAPTVLAMQAVVMPMEPDEIAALNIGQRVMSGITLYTTTALQTVSEKLAVAADVVTWGGYDYQVHTAAFRPQIEDLAHYKTTALRIEATS